MLGAGSVGQEEGTVFGGVTAMSACPISSGGSSASTVATCALLNPSLPSFNVHLVLGTLHTGHHSALTMILQVTYREAKSLVQGYKTVNGKARIKGRF
jgi:hypothetical protein